MAIEINISALPSGETLNAGDKILAARGQTNIQVSGASANPINSFYPPYASQFNFGMWSAQGATGSLAAVDTQRGLMLYDGTGDSNYNGTFKTLTRRIPTDMQSNFWMQARVSVNGMGGSRGHYAGICFTTAGSGTQGKYIWIGRGMPIGYSPTNQLFAYYADTVGNTSVTGPGTAGGSGVASHARWLRAEINGTVATVFMSEDGVLWDEFFSQDFGQPITQYGFYKQWSYAVPNPALIDYFDSAEFAADPSIRQVAGDASRSTPTGSDGAHEYWRLNVTKNWGATTLGIGNIAMRSAPGGANIAVGGTALTSGYSSGYNPAQSFQGEPSATVPGWLSSANTGWIGYHFPFPVVVQQIGYEQFVNGGYQTTPQDLSVDYSDDGVNWTTARSFTGQAPAEYHTYNLLNVLEDHDVVTSYQTDALPAKAANGGCRAAYSTRRLFDNYNGPLMSIQTTNGAAIDIYAGPDGYIDTVSALAVAKGGNAYIAAWYDQSGNGFHAVPMAQADPTAVRFNYRPMIVNNGVLQVYNGHPVVYFNGESPLDIEGLNMLKGNGSYVLMGIAMDTLAQNAPAGWGTGPWLLNGLVTTADAAGVCLDGNNNVLTGSPNGIVTGPQYSPTGPSIGVHTYSIVVAKMQLNGGAFTSQVGVNGPTLGDPSTQTYLNGEAVPRARLGGTAIAGAPNSLYQRMFQGYMGDVVVYDATSDLSSVYSTLTGHDGLSGVTSAIAGSITLSTVGQTKFNVPNYTSTITFEVYGGGAASGESSWDGPSINDDRGFDGPVGQGTYLCPPDGEYTVNAATQISITGSVGTYYVTGDPQITNALVIANTGTGGHGWNDNAGSHSFNFSNPGPASAAGTPGSASIRDFNSATDVVTTGGGSPGGQPAPYQGHNTQMGGVGGNGGYAKKVYAKTDANAPQTGDLLNVFIGAGGLMQGYGAFSNGTPGKIVVTWK